MPLKNTLYVSLSNLIFAVFIRLRLITLSADCRDDRSSPAAAPRHRKARRTAPKLVRAKAGLSRYSFATADLATAQFRFDTPQRDAGSFIFF